MKLALRWFGTGFDNITLEQIRQIPGVTGVITTLYDIPAEDAWPLERIRSIKAEVEGFGLEILGVESVNVPDAIKAALPERDLCIENYIKTLERLGTCNTRLVCYNFMPVFDWVRSDLASLEDGATALAYDQEAADRIDLCGSSTQWIRGHRFRLWLNRTAGSYPELFENYKDVDNEKLFENMVYFLKAVMPPAKNTALRWLSILTT